MTKELMAESHKRFPEMITPTYLIIVQYSSKSSQITLSVPLKNYCFLLVSACMVYSYR
jgi:hypothetical protein